MDSIIQAIDQEISRLQRVRSLLSQNAGSTTFIAKRGRKPGAASAKRAKRVLSPEARARMGAAQRKRWAAARRSK